MVAPLALYLLLIFALMLGVFISITWAAFKEAFADPEVWHAVYLSFFSSIISTALAFIFAVPSGYVLSRRRFPGMFLLDTLLDMPIVLPPLVMGLAVLLFFSTRFGRFIDRNVLEFVYTWRGIVLVQFVVGCAFATRAIKAGFDGFDRRYEEVAMTLGADRWQTFRKVILPIIRPSLIAGVVISWARIFGLFGPVLLVAGTMRGRTEIMPTRIYLEESIGRLEVALVIGALMIIFSTATLVAFKKLGGKGYLW
jgi:molybdate transport system permease protein